MALKASLKSVDLLTASLSKPGAHTSSLPPIILILDFSIAIVFLYASYSLAKLVAPPPRFGRIFSDLLVLVEFVLSANFKILFIFSFKSLLISYSPSLVANILSAPISV